MNSMMLNTNKWETGNMKTKVKSKIKSNFVSYLKGQVKAYGKYSVAEAIRTYQVSKAFGNDEETAREEAIYTLQEHSYEF